ncbi:MAG: V-type ATPase subunit, partial [Candidatus Thiodiazotropha sp.]
GGRIQRTSLMELANLENLQSIIEHLPEPYRLHLTDVANITQVRQRLDFLVAQEMRKLMRHSPDPVVSALAYLIARDIDLMRLYAIMQGKLLKMDQSMIEEAVPSNPLAATLETAA